MLTTQLSKTYFKKSITIVNIVIYISPGYVLAVMEEVRNKSSQKSAYSQIMSTLYKVHHVHMYCEGW